MDSNSPFSAGTFHRDRRQTLMRIAIFALCICFVFHLAKTSAAIPPRQDAFDDVFNASEVVIVKPGKPHSFLVDKSFEGTLAVGSDINLPDFKLVRFGEMDEATVVPSTGDTRILLFLHSDPKKPAAYSVTEDGFGFFFRDVSKVDELNTIATGALSAFHKWTAVRDLADHRQRMDGLLPYLSDVHPSCVRLTLDELVKLNPESGDYVASLIPTSKNPDSLLLAIRKLKTPKSHTAAIDAVTQAKSRFENWLKKISNLKPVDVSNQSTHLPADIAAAESTLRAGLAAVHTFEDRADLPFIRDLVPFLINNNDEFALQECISEMGQLPDPKNISVLNSIWKAIQSRPDPTDFESQMLGVDLANAAATRGDSSAVSMLIEMLDNPNKNTNDCAMNSLRVVTGKEFLTKPQWESWYAAQPKS